MQDFITFLIPGIPQGCVYALVAVGLVLTYKTSGVFNLAYGAQAYVSAALYYDFVVRSGWPKWLGFVVSVLIVAPLIGLILDRALFRFMRTSPWQVKLVSAIGLAVAIPEMVKLRIGTSVPFNPPGLASEGRFTFGDYGQITYNETVAVVATLAVVVGLAVMFRSTAIGLQMRAVVESPRMVEMNGIDSERVSMVAWMLSSFLAGLAGVLLVPLWATVDSANFLTLMVAALAATVFGRLSSIPLTFLGAMLLGVGEKLLAGYLPTDSIITNGLRGSLPFLLLFMLLIFSPALRNRREMSDPLAGVDPPPPAIAVAAHTEETRRLNKLVFYGFLVFLAAMVIFQPFATIDGELLGWTPSFTGNATRVLVYATIFLSITALTGMSGQISLATVTFVSIGAFTVSWFATEVPDVPVWLAMIIGAFIAAGVGVLLAIPGLRLGGIFLTLATLAFALMAFYMVFPVESISGGLESRTVPRPQGFADDQAFFFFAFIVFAIAGAMVVLVRKGTTGQYQAALRGSETAAQSIGINPVTSRIVIFAFSSFLAALGGGLFAMQVGSVNYQETELNPIYGLVAVVLVVTASARTVDGAVNAAIGYVFFTWLLADQFRLPSGIALIAFGLGAITYAKHPEGVSDFQKRLSIQRFHERRAMTQRAKALAEQGDLPPQVVPPPREVVFTLLTLGLYSFWFVYRTQRDLKRVNGEGLGGPLGVVLYTLVRFPTYFLVPIEIIKVARARGVRVPIRWTAGIGPTAVPLVILIVFVYGDPTLFGRLVLAIAVVGTFLGWISNVQRAANDLWIALAEQEHPTPVSPPSPDGAAPSEDAVSAAGAAAPTLSGGAIAGGAS